MKDNFNDNSIDNNLWTLTNPNSLISEVNNRIEISNPHTGSIANFSNKLESVKTISSGQAVGSCFLDWTVPNTSESAGGIILWVDNNNYISITSRSTNGQFRILLRQAGVLVYDLSSDISKGTNIKITYDISTFLIKLYYWSNGWVQMGTTQTYNIGNNVKIVLSTSDEATFTGANIIQIDDLFFTNKEFTTQYPR